MATPRKPTRPTAAAIDQFCARFDDLFSRRSARDAVRRYLIGLLLPREHHKTCTVLGALVPDTTRQRLHHFLHDAPWDVHALNQRRLTLWQEQRSLAPHARGVLIVDETGDPKRGQGIPLAANQYLGKLGHVANGVVAVTSQWADATRHVPLGVRPYWPAARLPLGKRDPDFHTKPELAWELIQEARSAGIPFRVVVADCVYGENPKLEARLWLAKLRYILALRPHRGTWQVVDDPANPPAFTPAEAAARVPLERWQRTVRLDSRGKELVRYVAELELGTAYGPTQAVRLIAATADPGKLDSDSTWYMATNLPASAATPGEVYTTYCLRDWIEHYYKPAKHELGWADFQTRQVEAIVRHWHLVMLAFTFSLVAGRAPARTVEQAATEEKKAPATRGVERDAAVRAQLVMPVGTHPTLLVQLVDSPAASRIGSPP